jgi:hypothetical protein
MTFITAKECGVWTVERGTTRHRSMFYSPRSTSLLDGQLGRRAVRHLVVLDEYFDDNGVIGGETIGVGRAVGHAIHPRVANAVYVLALHVPAGDHTFTCCRLAIDEQATVHGHVYARLGVRIAHPGRNEDR